MTKAELQAALDEERKDHRQVEQRLGDKLKLAREDLRNAEDELAEWDRLGLMAWPCPNSDGEPVCVTTDSDDPFGMSVDLFMRGGEIVGVEAYHKMSGTPVCAGGLTPAIPIEDRQ
jgi:hypothetical protein